MKLNKPQKLEQGRYFAAAAEIVERSVFGTITGGQLYLTTEHAAPLSEIRQHYVQAIVDNSQRWFTTSLTADAVVARFLGSKSSITDIPEWARDQCTFPFLGSFSDISDNEEVECTITFDGIIIAPPQFIEKWSISNIIVKERPEERIDLSVDDAIEAIDLTIAAEGQEDDRTKIIKLVRNDDNEDDKQRARKRLRRARMRALLMKMRAEQIEDEYFEQFPDSDADESFDEINNGSDGEDDIPDLPTKGTQVMVTKS